jgi:hypothetical protein
MTTINSELPEQTSPADGGEQAECKNASMHFAIEAHSGSTVVESIESVPSEEKCDLRGDGDGIGDGPDKVPSSAACAAGGPMCMGNARDPGVVEDVLSEHVNLRIRELGRAENAGTATSGGKPSLLEPNRGANSGQETFPRMQTDMPDASTTSEAAGTGSSAPSGLCEARTTGVSPDDPRFHGNAHNDANSLLHTPEDKMDSDAAQDAHEADVTPAARAKSSRRGSTALPHAGAASGVHVEACNAQAPDSAQSDSAAPMHAAGDATVLMRGRAQADLQGPGDTKKQGCRVADEQQAAVTEVQEDAQADNMQVCRVTDVDEYHNAGVQALRVTDAVRTEEAGAQHVGCARMQGSLEEDALGDTVMQDSAKSGSLLCTGADAKAAQGASMSENAGDSKGSVDAVIQDSAYASIPHQATQDSAMARTVQSTEWERARADACVKANEHSGIQETDNESVVGTQATVETNTCGKETECVQSHAGAEGVSSMDITRQHATSETSIRLPSAGGQTQLTDVCMQDSNSEHAHVATSSPAAMLAQAASRSHGGGEQDTRQVLDADSDSSVARSGAEAAGTAGATPHDLHAVTKTAATRQESCGAKSAAASSTDPGATSYAHVVMDTAESMESTPPASNKAPEATPSTQSAVDSSKMHVDTVSTHDLGDCPGVHAPTTPVPHTVDQDITTAQLASTANLAGDPSTCSKDSASEAAAPAASQSTGTLLAAHPLSTECAIAAKSEDAEGSATAHASEVPAASKPARPAIDERDMEHEGVETGLVVDAESQKRLDLLLEYSDYTEEKLPKGIPIRLFTRQNPQRLPRISIRLIDSHLHATLAHPLQESESRINLFLQGGKELREHVASVVQRIVREFSTPGKPRGRGTALQYVTQQAFVTTESGQPQPKFQQNIAKDLANLIMQKFFNAGYLRAVQRIRGLSSAKVSQHVVSAVFNAKVPPCGAGQDQELRVQDASVANSAPSAPASTCAPEASAESSVSDVHACLPVVSFLCVCMCVCACNICMDVCLSVCMCGMNACIIYQ